MEESIMKEAINQGSVMLTDLYTANNQYPCIRLDGEQIWLGWQCYCDCHDSIIAARLVEGKAVEETVISGDGEALHPAMVVYDGAVWYTWSECKDREWRILVRFVKAGTWSEVIEVSRSEAAFYPNFVISAGQLYVLWSEQGKGFSHTMMAWIADGKVVDQELVSTSAKAYRPRAIEGGDGNLYLTYDAFNGKTYDILTRVKTSAGWSQEHKVNITNEWETSPVLAAIPNGAVVCWYNYGARAAFAYYSADLSVKDGQIASSAPDCFSKGVDWYQNVDVASNSNGVQAFAYTWGKYNIQVRYRKDHGAWSAPVTMSYDDGHCAVHPKLILDNTDRIHLVWQFAHMNGHEDRNAAVVYNNLILAEVDKYANPDKETGENTFTHPIPIEKALDKHADEAVRQWLDKNSYENLELKFGDIHGQSTISDGVGEVDQYYHSARTNAGLDFTALTDHDCYPDWISQSEFEWMRTTNKLMNTDGELACLLAYEWTPNEYRYDYGHKNVYYRGDDGEMFRSGDVGGMTPFHLFESIRKYGAQCIPHHPAAKWSMVSAATDWNFHDPEAQRLVEIFSRHANFEKFEDSSKYTKNIDKYERCNVQDALARKYHLGFTAGSDSHQMEHGVEGGIVAAFVPELTREAVFDSLYDRFVYATSGARMLVSLRVNGCRMGEEITTPAGKAVKIEVSVLGTDTGVVQVIKNNQVIKEQQTDGLACDFVFEDLAEEADTYYYVRVEQNDGHLAWSSPVWVS